MQNPNFGKNYKIRNPNFKIRNPESQIQKKKSEIQNPKILSPDFGFSVRQLEIGSELDVSQVLDH